MNIDFEPKAWGDFIYWAETNKKIVKRINAILKELSRDPESRPAKAEILRGNLQGWMSCRIDKENRLVFKIENNRILVAQCKGHY
ncbi:MAG: Txe/YoeB family addiction module toxin [Candidatus Ancillula sp.]|jgi:toxin YoeB|nr:Txe/YoeB family addiction module toxin [Candidatus Ancillula sp.]